MHQITRNCNFTEIGLYGVFRWLGMVNSMGYNWGMKIRHMPLCSFQPALSNGVSFVIMRWFFIKMHHVNYLSVFGVSRYFSTASNFG